MGSLTSLVSDLWPDIAGYVLTERLYFGPRSAVYRAVQATSERPVVIKVLRQAYPSFGELVQFRNQYTIAKNLPIAGIVQPLSLELLGSSYALIMENWGGVSLNNYTQQNYLNLVDVLAIALQLADILHDLCQHQVVHKDIKPANILISPETKQVKLIDFSIASLLIKETQEIQSPNILEGTLAYLAPEQTGRMNRSIDYRADFYALGVTLYQLLGGRLPFISDDPLELLHCHIAKMPVPVNQVNAAVPEMVGAIVTKLMAKNAEDRYQSAIGLKHDLQQCLTQWQETGEIPAFELGQRDLSDRFLIPEKLYGRETEVQALLDAFERVATGSSELMLVEGFSGIGKTAVVNEVHKPITQQNGYFIKGKFDQLNRNIPLSAFVQALRDLMGQLLCESDAQLAQWQAQILQALGENGQVLIDVIPELEQIIGKQSIVPELSGSAAQNRFNLLFQKFIEVLTTADHPLVLFLEDLQWADLASLELIKLLMNDNGYLLVLGAYRNNEVSAAHPFILTVEELKKNGAIVHTITLSALAFKDTNHLIADTLNCSIELAQPLTELIDRKTKGNPFFTTQFLKALHEDGQINFDRDQNYWQCDIAQVNSLALTDDVVEFMAVQLQKLPSETQLVIQLAACIGNQFDLATLTIISERSPTDVAMALRKALQEGLLVPTSQVYKFFQSADSDLSNVQNNANPVYRFLHDRIQQAAYSLIPESHRTEIHYRIGRLLVAHFTDAIQESRIFELVSHLNLGRGLIIDPTERRDLARLNLIAGRKAMSSTAYGAAFSYFKQGIDLLTADSWQCQSTLTLELHLEAAETSYLCQDFDQTKNLTAHILSQSLSVFRAYEIQILAAIAQGQLLEAINIGRIALQLVDIELPQVTDDVDFEREFKEVSDCLQGKSISELSNLPSLNDTGIHSVIKVLSRLFSPTYIALPALMPIVIFRMVKLSIRYGNSPESSFAYSLYGLILCNITNDIESGCQFGDLALNLVEKINAKEYEAKVLHIHAVFIQHHQEHLSQTIPRLVKSYISALETGDQEFASYSAFNFCTNSLWLGTELEKLVAEMSMYSQSVKQLGQPLVQTYLNIHWQVVINLLGQTQNPCRLVGSAYDQDQMLVLHQDANDLSGMGFLLICKLILGYLFGDMKQAVDCANQAETYANALTGFMHIPLLHFYKALALLNSQREPLNSLETDWLVQFQVSQAVIRKRADNAPMNFLHKWQLIEAERQATLGNKAEAIDLYDRAILGAKENGYIQEEALANELAAKFYLNWGKEKIAAGYMQEAYYRYGKWGAKAKTDRLELEYPQLLQPIIQKVSSPLSVFETLATRISPVSFSQRSTGQTSSDNSSSSHSLNEVLDLAALLQVSQAISSAIDIDELLQILTQTMLKTSGGDRCVLLLCQDNQWQVRAIANLQETILESVPLENNSTVPIRLIQYIKNTLETVVINNLITDLPRVIGDYLRQYRPKSVLSLPILNQGNLVGILYLENSLVSDVFTSDRLLALNFLVTQAAISLENTRLYQLEQQRFQKSQEQTSVLTFRAAIDSNLTRSGTLQEMLQGCTEIVVDYLDAAFARIWTVSADENILELQASAGLYTHLNGDHSQVPIGQFKIGLIAQERLPHLTNDVLNDPRVGDKAWAASEGMVSFAGYPLLVDDQLLGVIAIFARRPLGTAILDALAIAAYEISLGLDRKQTEIALQISESHLRQKSQDLEQALKDLQQSQLQTVQSEKMASLGTLVAGVAHEINNPMGFLNGSIQHLKDHTGYLMGHLELYQQHYPNPVAAIQDNAEEIDLEFLSEDLPKLLNSMTGATDRIKGITISLRNFSRADTEYKVSANLNEGIDSTLLILKYRLKGNQHRPEIQVRQTYGELPLIQCFPGPLNQVFMNILANAIDMFDEIAQQSEFINLEANPQIITIKTALTEQNTVEIRIIDNGKGMPEDVRARIFDHLFTTKGVGKGTGLGLAIARQIVLEKHGGGLEVGSQLNQGTEFCISLPIGIE
ncbi:MAG: trifunctional serine/threonine-protein kinase/ATP-binding protein/sensor histidine kinase [Alkalinema sp. CAN_BIN05]|nr:trifunctional serine/threonine-protein kinase/ATP-binding protein/sensor histidine kinase [Alkalinema sp. CAN_BIN05]